MVKDFHYFSFFLSYRDFGSFLPGSSKSILYRTSVQAHRKADPPGNTDSSLSLFQSAPFSSDGKGGGGAVFFAGGPVWAMDWLPSATPLSQWVALAAYKELDEVR